MSNQIQSMVSIFTLLLAAQAGADTVRIELRPEGSVDSEVIRLNDIARISGCSAVLKTELEQLDISQLTKDTDSVNIRHSLVAIRLQLAGWSTQEFMIFGSAVVNVKRREPQAITDASVEAAALKTMQLTLNVGADQLRVQLNSPFMSSLTKRMQQDDSLRVEVLPPVNSRIGAASLTVRFWRGDQLIYARTGKFEILRRQQVAVTRTSLPRNHILTERDFQIENRFMAIAADQLDEKQVLGRQVRGTLKAGDMISLRDLQPAAIPQQQELIRARDNVQITAVSGRLKVHLTSAQALQNGRLGQTIRVKNLKSNEIVTGRVTAPGQVEIRL
jgi:flagella basal body P-ring formation protein FlgA